MTCRFLDPQQSASFLRSTLECRRLPFSELRSNPYNDCTRLATLLRGLRDCIEKTSRRILQRLLKSRSEEHTSELQSQSNLVCRLLLEKTINRAKARVAILYSPPSMYWEKQYAGTLLSVYTALSLIGEKVTFVSEKQLVEGRAANVEWIIRPMATHVSEPAMRAMKAFKTIDIGATPDFDEYDRKRSTQLESPLAIDVDEQALSGRLR